MLRLFLLLTLCLLAGLAALLLTRMRSTPPLLATVVPANDTGSEPPRTTFAATLDEAHVAGRNLLWCATFQLAWEQLAGVVGAPPRLADDPPLARRLSSSPAPQTGLDERSHVAVGGFGESARARVVERLRQMSAEPVPPRLLPERLEAYDAVAFAWLRVELPFEVPFRPVETGLLFDRRQVSAFGSWDDGDDELGQRRARQVRIWRYVGPADFIVELRTKDPRERLVVARLEPGATLGQTVETVLGQIGEGSPQPPQAADRLVIPRLSFDRTHSYPELIGQRLSNPGFTEHVLVAAAQNIHFRLDEHGARLRSESALVGAFAAPVPLPRRMICDGPFLVLLLRAGAPSPYFALWVENAELLLPTTTP